MLGTGFLSSLSRVGSASYATTDVRQQKVEGTSARGSYGSPLVGGMLVGGIAAGILGYRGLATEAKYGIAKGISKFFNAPTLQDTIVGLGVNKGLPGAAAEVLNVAYNTEGFSKGAALSVLKAFEERSSRNTTSGLASINDLLVHGGLNSRMAGHIQIASEKLAYKAGVDTKRVLNLKLGDHIIKESNNILMDYRGRTLGGMLGEGLEFSHRNFKIPFTNFAPSDIFLHKAWANQYKSAVVNGGSSIGGIKVLNNAIAIGNKVIEKTGRVIEYNRPLKVLQENTSLAYSSHAVKGELKHKITDRLINEGDYGYFANKYLKGQKYLRNMLMSPEYRDKFNMLIQSGDWESAQNLINKHAPAMENLMFSPKYAKEHSMGRGLRTKFQRLVEGKIQFKDKPLATRSGAGAEKYTEQDLSLFERTLGKWFRGDSDKYNWVDSSGTTIGSGVMGPIKTHGYQNLAPGAFPDDVFHSNKLSNIISTTHTAVTAGELAKAAGHFLVERPVRLLEQLTGLGIKPSNSITSTFLAGTLGAGALLYGGVEAAKYANFLGMGIPSKVVGGVIGGAQIASSAVADATGISTVSSTLEDNLPGSINSFASQIARGVGLPILGAFLGEKYLANISLDMSKHKALRAVAEDIGIQNAGGRKLGALIGVAAAAASFIVDPTASTKQTYEETVGDKKVPIRNARWWFAGRQPFAGDKVKYHDYSIAHQLWTSGAADNTTYGSETQRWAHSWLPTPTNLFGIVPLMDPYHADEQNQAYRPYPITSAAGANLPVIGPAFSATIGNIIKPQITRDVGGIESGSYGPNGASSKLGFSPMGGTLEPGSSNISMANQQVSNVQDYLGLFGFISEFPLNAMFGSGTGLGGGSALESSSNINDPGRELQDMNLGGFFGTTEFPRRLFPGRSKNTTYLNPMDNAAPSWLPGSGSMFEGDKDYMIDFHKGDMYTKVEKGETRLPGKGYEAATGLHGGNNYDYLDIYNILSDVAPGSQAHARYKSAVFKNIEKGGLTAEEVQMVSYREAENNERLGGKYNFVDYSNKPSTTNSMGDQIKEYLGYINIQKTNTNQQSIFAPAQALWDQASHFQVPGFGTIPMTSWAQGKFLHNRTPYEEYVQGQIVGTDFANWNDPYGAFIEPAAFQTLDFATPNNTFVPARVSKRREVEEYYDKLKYLKARRLQMSADQLGDTGLSSHYARQQNETVVGIPYTPSGVNKNIFQALPSAQRPFAAAIAQATPEEIEKFRKVLPSHQKNLWETVWSGNTNSGREINGTDPRLRADEEVAEYFSQRNLPSNDSNVWNPDVNIDEFKIRTLEQEQLSYYEEGIPEIKAREYRQLGRADLIVDTSPFTSNIGAKNALLEELNRNRSVTDYSVSSSSIPRNNSINYNDPERKRMYDRTSGRF